MIHNTRESRESYKNVLADQKVSCKVENSTKVTTTVPQVMKEKSSEKKQKPISAALKSSQTGPGFTNIFEKASGTDG